MEQNIGTMLVELQQGVWIDDLDKSMKMELSKNRVEKLVTAFTEAHDNTNNAEEKMVITRVVEVLKNYAEWPVDYSEYCSIIKPVLQKGFLVADQYEEAHKDMQTRCKSVPNHCPPTLIAA